MSLFLLCFARGGSYTLPTAPHGGVLHTNLYGYYAYDTPYTWSAGSGVLMAVAGGGHTSVSGAVQFTFVWSGPEAPPKSVVLKKTGFVYRYSDTSVSNTVSDGLGHTEVVGSTAPYAGSSTSSGDKYEVIPNPGSSFTVTITPAGDVNDGFLMSQFSVAVTPVTVSVGGALLKDGSFEALIGQYLWPSLSAAYQISNIHWSVPGNSYESVTWTNHWTTPSGTADDHVYNLLPASALTQDSPRFFHLEPQSDLISASATVTFPDNTTATINGETGVEVTHPDFGLSTGTSGTSQYTGLITLESGDYFGTGSAGMTFNFYVSQTLDFQHEGSEFCAPSQLVKANRDVYLSGSSTKSYSVHNPAFVLDTSTFYAGPFAASASGGSWQTDDTPMQGAAFGTDGKIVVGDDFKMFLVYLAPEPTGGTSEWVPLSVKNWNWHCTAEESSPGIWGTPVGNPATQGGSDYPGLLWQWNDYQSATHDVN